MVCCNLILLDTFTGCLLARLAVPTLQPLLTTVSMIHFSSWCDFLTNDPLKWTDCWGPRLPPCELATPSRPWPSCRCWTGLSGLWLPPYQLALPYIHSTEYLSLFSFLYRMKSLLREMIAWWIPKYVPHVWGIPKLGKSLGEPFSYNMIQFYAHGCANMVMHKVPT